MMSTLPTRTHRNRTDRCSWTGCSVRTSIKVGHYNPDLVVSTYNELGGNPWTEIRATLGLAQKTAATGLLGALLPVPIDSAVWVLK